MLYNLFKFVLMVSSFLSILDMVETEEFKYIYFPIAIIVWVIYTYFRANDKQYLEMRGYDPNTSSWQLLEDAICPPIDFNASYEEIQNQSPQITVPRRRYITPYIPKKKHKINPYKNIAKKCKRNFKITISN